MRYLRLVIASFILTTFFFCHSVAGQTATYHLHKEASAINTSFDKLLTAGPDASITALTTVLTNKNPGEYVIKEFETQTGVPNAPGVIPNGSTLSFSLWMRKTANVGTVFPRAKIRLNNASGTLLCTATGATALTTTVTQQNLSCTTSADITMTASDRFYLWAGVNLTVKSSTTFNGELDIEGTLNGNYDSQITLPTATGTPTISSLTPNTGAVGSSIVIAGTNFRSSQLGSTVKFNGTTATNITSWGPTSITATVPTGATTGNVVVTVGGQASIGVTFTVTATPSITSLTPSTGAVGSSIVIAGSNFNPQGTGSAVTFNGVQATTITSWTNTSITATVPSGATTGNVVVTAAGGVASPGSNFTVTPPPTITSVTPSLGAVGASVVIAGSNFGPSIGNGNVKFNGTSATSIPNWSATSITATVPSGATTGNVVVTAAGGVASAGSNFTVVPAPVITDLSPTTGAVGAEVSIAGANFGATQGSGSVTFNGTAATPTSWSASTIAVPVPSGATSGNVVVNASGVASNGLNFTVVPAPSITSLSVTSGHVGDPVTITGTNFGATEGSGTVSFNGTDDATPTSWSSTSILAHVPVGATSGNLVVSASGVASNGINFTVTEALGITAVSPTSGVVGEVVTVTGTGFGSTQGGSTIKLNGPSAVIASWSDTSIVVYVPSGATTGPFSVTVMERDLELALGGQQTRYILLTSHCRAMGRSWRGS